MLHMEAGDLQLTASGSRTEQLFHAIRHKIVSQLWPLNGKLPSTRQLAQELNMSRNTVIAAYEQLVAEGYIESRQGSGFYVAVALPEQFVPDVVIKDVQTKAMKEPHLQRAFRPGVGDFEVFPYRLWQSMLQRHSSRRILMGSHDPQGLPELRHALSDYLASSRSVSCDPSRIIITSGAQQALALALLATLSSGDDIMMEQPGYTQMRTIINTLGYRIKPIPVRPISGLDLDHVLKQQARALYLTPSNQYPMGTTLNTEQRLALIQWAQTNKSWIIEDDYDSEFQFAHRPYTSMQGLAAKIGLDQHLLYVGSFSKILFNGLRLGYLVVPSKLVDKCVMLKNVLTGDTPAHSQAALADFMMEGHLLRHIRKMRRHYQTKRELMVEALHRYLGDKVDIISQAAGLHITLRWQTGITEQQWVEAAQKEQLMIRAMSYYDEANFATRGWHGVVLGFGNAPLEKIDEDIRRLAKAFAG